MKQKFILAFVILLLVACTPSAQAIQTAIAQTQAAIPAATSQPTRTPLPDIKSVLLNNGFIFSNIQSYTNAKQYEFSNSLKFIVVQTVVFDNGMLSITMYDFEEVKKVNNVILSIYGSTVSNWIAPIIEGKTFLQPFERNGNIDGYNIEITLGGQKLTITIMPESQ